jgi:hypothetical protein
VIRIFVGKPEGKIFARPRHRWEDLKGIGCEDMNWTYLGYG